MSANFRMRRAVNRGERDFVPLEDRSKFGHRTQWSTKAPEGLDPFEKTGPVESPARKEPNAPTTLLLRRIKYNDRGLEAKRKSWPKEVRL